MRQRQIEHDERRTTLLESHQRGEPISGDIHIKACKSQRATVHRGAGLVVFDDQNAITNPWFEPYHSVLSSILKEPALQPAFQLMTKIRCAKTGLEAGLGPAPSRGKLRPWTMIAGRAI